MIGRVKQKRTELDLKSLNLHCLPKMFLLKFQLFKLHFKLAKFKPFLIKWLKKGQQ